MNKIFTLLSGLLLMVPTAAKADTVYCYLNDYDGNEVADSFESGFSIDEEGNLVIEDFLYSEAPLKFNFDKNAPVEEWSDITFAGYLDRSEDYPYLMSGSGEYDYMTVWLQNYDEEEEWTPVYWPYVSEEGYSCVWHYDTSDPDIKYEYYANICMSGSLVISAPEEGDEEGEYKYGYLPWTYINFFFNIPDNNGINGISAPHKASTVYYTLTGQRVENPANGLYIRKQGNDVKKVILH